MNVQNLLHDKYLIYKLLAIHFLLRLFAAACTTLGNDEVYYTLYAKYPDIAYFDHPPLVGWMIWLTTMGTHFSHEIFIRLGALVIGSANVYLLWLCGIHLRNAVAGNIAALLGAASFYVSVIAGVFVLPDTPQSFFWMLSLWLFLRYQDTSQDRFMLLFGLSAGFALLSKYHGVYLWLGAGLYFLMYDRMAIRKPVVYASALISFLIFLPVLVWNFHSPYSGIAYHEGRVGSSSLLPNFKFFFPELFGQLFYNNPFNAFLAVVALLKLRQDRNLPPKIKFLLCAGLPLIFTTLAMAMYNKTLPHWSGPGWFSLILAAAYVFSEEQNLHRKALSFSLKAGALLFTTAIILALFQVGTGYLLANPKAEPEKLGKDDFTADLSQWHSIGAEMEKIIPPNSAIVTHNWFPAAHLTHYFGDKNCVKVYVCGTSDRKHQFLKINKDLGSIKTSQPVYFVTASHFYQAPDSLFMKDFDTLSPRQELPVLQNGRKKINIFYWKAKAKKDLVP